MTISLEEEAKVSNNSTEFIARRLQHGLYIPHKDPEWEADEDFYNYRYILRILQVIEEMVIRTGSKGKQQQHRVHSEEPVAGALHSTHKDPEWEADEDFNNYRLSYRAKGIEPRQSFRS